MKLFICEKPAQGRDIARNLQCSIKKEGYIEGQGVVVTWCIGHLLQQQPPGFYEPNNKPWRRAALPIVPTTWKKCVVDKTGKQFRIIQALLKKADTVVIATDADREGDVIARELLDFCNYKGNVERLWLSALDDTSIQKALADIRPGNSTGALYAAGLGRQRADWLVGMNMTMATTSYFSKGQGVLSVGRVQTPTLQLVVNRDKAIEEFKSETYYVLNATFKTADSIPFVTTWQVPALIADDNGRCVDSDAIKKVANSISQNAGFIAQFYDKPKTQAPPTCLTLSTLQKLASQYFSLGAKKTQEVAQRLYETYKATTYPRTDCGYLPLSQFNDAPDIIHAMGNTLPALQALVGRADTRIQSPVWNDEKITAHHAIIPTTNCNVKVDAMSEIERKLYSLICRYYLAQFLGDYTYSQRKVVVKCANETFVASRNTPVEQGFRLAIGRVMEDKKENDTSSIIPDVTVGDATQTLDAEVLDKQTKAPPRYTEGSLIAAMKNIAKTVSDAALKKTLMESAGIGTEATRATIIELLLKRNFLTTSGKYIISTEKGRTLLTYCPELLKNPATTAQWEQMLEDVAKGVVTLDQFLHMQKTALEGMLEGIDTLYHKAIPAVKPEDNAHPCISCQKPMVKKQGKHGVFWSCSGYPNCMTTMQDDNGKPAIKKPHVTSNVDCPTCKQHKLVKRQGRKAPFWGCSGFPTCRAMFWDKDNQPDFVNIPKARGAA